MANTEERAKDKAPSGGGGSVVGDPSQVEDIDWRQAPVIFASGMCMGTADVVPGVSGGTMAVALGIYRQLLAALASINATSLKALVTFKLGEAFRLIHWRFLAVLLTGVIAAVGIMVKVVKLPELIKTQQAHVYAVFFGLVLASAILLGRRIKWAPTRAVSFAVGVAAGFAVVNLVPVDTPTAGWFLFLSGFIAISAMLLPGISGSFILLILGKYAFILAALSNLELGVILPFVAGCAVGVVSFSRVVGYLLKRWHDTTLANLTGLLIGSLWRIWPYQNVETIIVREKERPISATPFWPETLEVSVLLLLLAGIAAVFIVEALAQRRASSVAESTSRAADAKA